MSSGHEATCLCGFHANITVGGNMADYRKNSPFPFYCKNCGLVSVNTAGLPSPPPSHRLQMLIDELKEKEQIEFEIIMRPNSKSWPRRAIFRMRKFLKGWRAKRLPVCPKCKTTEVVQYGTPPVSSVPKDKHAVLQNFGFEAFSDGNLCPKCKRMTLVFSRSIWLGD